MHRVKFFLGLLIMALSACSPTELTAQSEETQSVGYVTTATAGMTPTKPTNPEGVIAFYSDMDGNPEIYIMQADGSGLLRLTNDPAFDDCPTLSPISARLCSFPARDDRTPTFPDLKYEIYLVDIDGQNLHRLTETETGEDIPPGHLTGQKIIFDADYDGDGFYEIYTIDPDGTN